MKEGWKYVKLGDILDVKHGKDHKEVLSPNGQYPIYGSGGSIMGYATDFLCEKGTTILGRKGTIDKPLYIESRFWNIDTAFGLVPKNGNNSKLIYYICKTIDWKNLDSGAAKPSLTQAIIKKQCANIPPLSEQQRIVEELDSAFAKIDALKVNAEKLVEEAKALFAASLREIMTPQEGWEEKKLGEVITNLRTGLNPRVHFKLNTEDAEGYYITVRELKGFTFEVDNKTDRINDSAIIRINQRSNIQIGDVLYSGTGTIGRTAIVEEEPTWWNVKEGVYILTPDYNLMQSRFLVYLLHSNQFHSGVIAKTSGTTVRSIPMKELVKVLFSLPPLPEQTRIVSTLDTLSAQVRQLEANFKKVSEECDALKQAILRETFE